jgi:hypothetical protein
MHAVKPPRLPRAKVNPLSAVIASDIGKSLGYVPGGRGLSQVEPAIGRGYRTGHHLTVPALAGSAMPAVLLANLAHIEKVTPFKLTLGTSDDEGNDPGIADGALLRFFVSHSIENDRFHRVVDVTVGNAQVIYVTARSIKVEVENEQAFTLQADMALDEASPGVSVWYVQERFPALGVEVAMDIPPFCQEFRVYTPTGVAPARLRGYAPGGTLFVDQNLTVPSSGEIQRIPGLDYTLTASAGGPTAHIVNYSCFG